MCWQVPLAVIGGHKKAVSYVRWMDGTRLISASTDNQLKLWDINSGIVTGAQNDRRPINVLSGAGKWASAQYADSIVMLFGIVVHC